MTELVHKNLSYRIIGIVFKVYNKLGYGYQEKYYQRAVALEIDREKLNYIREKEIKLNYQNQTIGKYSLIS